MYTIDGPDYEVKKVKMSKEKKSALMSYLVKSHDEVLQGREKHEERWKGWHLQANGRRKRKGAGARDSDIDVPTTREYMMQNSARIQTPILQQDQIMVAEPAAPIYEKVAKGLEPGINWMVDRIDPRVFMDLWIEQFQTYHAGFVKTGFQIEYEFVKHWQKVEEDEDPSILKSAGVMVVKREMDDGSVVWFKETETKRIKRSGSFPEVIPIEDIIIPLTAVDIQTSPFVTHRMWPTKNEIKFRIKQGIWDEKNDDKEEILPLLQKSDRERITHPVDSPEEIQPGIQKQYDIRETYLLWEVDGEDVEIIATWEPKSQQFLNIIYNYFHEYARPFVAHTYKPVPNSIYGIPLTFIIQSLHIAYSASINQRLDAASLANETLIFGPSKLELAEQADATIRGGYYATNATKDEIWSLNLGSTFSQLPDLERVFEEHMQKLSGLSDYSFGQEQVGRPTATGTMQLVEEAKHPQYLQLERFRKSFADVVKHMASRYKQFYPEGMKLYLTFNRNEDGSNAWEEISVNWPEGSFEDSVVIKTKVSSSTMSKNMRKQEVIALVDKMPQIYEPLTNFAMMASMPNPQAPGQAIIGLSLLASYQNVIDKFLTEFEIADKKVVNPPLVQEAQVAKQINDQFMALQQQLQQCVAENNNLKMQLQQIQGGPPPGMAPNAGPPPGPQGPGPMGPGM